VAEIRISEAVHLAIEAQQELLGSGATVLDAARIFHQQMSDGYRSQWLATKNPIWIWHCLTRLKSFSVQAANCFPELTEQKIGDDVPNWCIEYLLDAAYKIEALAGGRDFRNSHAHPESVRTAFSNEILPRDMPCRLPAALGFVRPGWSAFKQYQNEDVPRLHLALRDVEKLAGRKPSLGIGDLMEAMGWTDERHAHRKLAEVRRHRAKPKG
jgi:hypothetical protein